MLFIFLTFSALPLPGVMYTTFLVTRVSKGVVKFSSSTTVDSQNENHQISTGLHENQRVGGEVDSMYDEEQVAAPDHGIDSPIDTPLYNAASCIDPY